MAEPARTRGGRQASRLLCAVLLASSACTPPSLRGQSIPDPLDSPEGIVALGRAGELVYALTRNHKLRTWDLRTGAMRTLDGATAVGVARDGAIALRRSGAVLDAWEPRSGSLIASHRFEPGFAGVQGVSRATAYVVVMLPPVSWPENAAALPPSDRELVSWDFASGKIEVVGGRRGCDHLSLSVDGTSRLCDLGWRDRSSDVTRNPPPLAPEWPAARPNPAPPPCLKCQPPVEEIGYDPLSAWLSNDGRTVYLTYARATDGIEWRLDRWIPDPTGKTDGRIERLAVSHERIGDRVVAASQDGRTVLTDPGLRPPMLRHAPAYEGIPLLAPAVTAAVFSENDRLVVTGHGDGRLRVWETDIGRFVRISGE
jgi:hypothetical protein